MLNFTNMLSTPYQDRLVPTLIPEIDSQIGGFEHSDLVIIAAVSSMGKTSFALKLAKNFAMYDKPVAVFSLEMNEEQLMTRLVSDETMVPIRKIRYGDVTDGEMDRVRLAINSIADSNMIVDCRSSMLSQICNKIRKMKLRDNIELVIVDYLQLVQYEKKGINREQQVATIVRTFKNIAKELNIVIIALSQLNRQVDQRDDKRPRLGDLRESGEIEQAADNVIFIYRPAYYDLECHDNVQDVDIMIAKGRNTGIGKATLKFIPNCTKFLSAEEANKMILT